MTTPLDATALVTSESGTADQSRRELQAKLNGLGGLGGRKLSPEAREKKLREACEGFESVFIQKMWQEMRNTIPKSGLMHGKEERFWQDMYDQELSKSMTSAGGIGLADMMYAQLSRNLVSASRSAAGASQSRAFTPEAAPFLDTVSAAPAAEGTSAVAVTGNTAVGTAAVAAIYDGVAPSVAAAQKEGGAVPAAPAGIASGQTAASAPAEQDTGQGEVVELNPEVERALAALRARQALHRQEEADAAIEPRAKVAAQTVASTDAHHQRPMASSGIELAQVARREAGDKLGSHAVRPPLHQPSPRHATNAAQPQQGAVLDGTASAQAVADAGDAQGAARPRNVRFSTNMRPQERAKRGLKPIRVLNVDNVGVNSKAGAGIAAYHAASEAQVAATPGIQVEQTVQAAQPQPAPPQPETAASGNFTIPPLTAADARG